MNRKEKASLVFKVLEEYFPNPPIPLKHHDAFTLLVAVVLSAQCTDDRVNIVTEELFRRAPSAAKMVSLSHEEILEIIRSCGLAPTKAKALKRLSEIILEKHEGKVPNTFEELEALPGVGHKTASVIMAQVFKKPAFPVDTHIFRAAHRWGLSTKKSVEGVEEDLKKAFPRSSWNKLHLQIIYFCRTFCTAKKHDPEKCPLCSHLK